MRRYVLFSLGCVMLLAAAQLVQAQGSMGPPSTPNGADMRDFSDGNGSINLFTDPHQIDASSVLPGQNVASNRFDLFGGLGRQIFGTDVASGVETSVQNKENPAAAYFFTIVKIVLSFLGGLMLLLGVYAAYLWMTAGGNEEQVGKARNLIRDAMIGAALILMSYALTQYLAVTVAGVNKIKVQTKQDCGLIDNPTVRELRGCPNP